MKNFKLINNVVGWITFLIASTVYLLTIEPTASFWDCGEFIASAYKMEIGHPPGAPFFMLTANLFSQFASDPSNVAMMVNSMSALFSGLSILFLFWSVSHLSRHVIVGNKEEISLSETITIIGCGLVGALAYTFSDTFWFSAVEGEVYAYSSLFTAVVFWLILKWEEVADTPHADRWIVLIAFLMGLSIGVHLLNLLCIPAIVLVYYYRKFPNPTMKGTIIALLISFAIIGLMMYGVVQGLVEVCGWFELFFVNTLGMPYNSGVYAYIIILAGVLIWGIWETMRDKTNPIRMKISFLISVILLGIPFIGNGYVIGIILIIALAIYLFKKKSLNIQILNTILVSLMVIVIGYSSYAVTLIRATADTPMNQNAPKDVFKLRAYLAREQYGQNPLFYGQTYASEIKRVADGNSCIAVMEKESPIWSRIIKKDPNEKDRYFISQYSESIKYVDEMNMLFPRMYSDSPTHIQAYKEWGKVKGEPVTYTQCGETKTVMKPTFLENIRFFLSYQVNFMYWRYFMWNFSGRQNDIQGFGDILHGNWITGISFIDEFLVGPQEDQPYEVINNKGHNVYYMLPLLLGILGLLYQANAGKKGIQSFWITFFLFFMTGIAIVMYLNQTPYQPRERDYAYAGSFYAFCIWIGFGVAALAKSIRRYLKIPAVTAAIAATVLCLIVPIQMAAQNWDDHDRSGRYVCRDFGSNYLESCEPNAIIFTNGDNDTFPLWYAQGVEGRRTDVRVCNASYLQTDWYINQMKRQAYDSEPLPISWNYEDYIQGTRDAAHIIPAIKDKIDLKAALDFVRSNDPATKKLSGYSQELTFIPSDKLSFRIDSVAAKKVNTDAPELAKSMEINLEGKVALIKNDLIVLDMLQTNNWERPMYFAITVDPKLYLNMEPYFQQTGMTYQIVPAQVKGTKYEINTERMYDNVMNKFKWGGVDKKGVYLDENVLKMCKSYRSNIFSNLAQALINQGKLDKALAVLDKCMEVFPPENVPIDGSALSLAEAYYMLNQKEKAEKIYSAIADNAIRNINWFCRLPYDKLLSVSDMLRHNLAVLQNVVQVTKAYDPEFSKQFQEELDNFNMAFQPINKEKEEL